MKTMYHDSKQHSPVCGYHAIVAAALVFLPVLLNAQSTSTVDETATQQRGITTIGTPVTTEFASYTPYRVPAFRPGVGGLEPELRSNLSNVIVPRDDFSWDQYFAASERAALLRNQVAMRPEQMGSFGQAYAGMDDLPDFVPFITTDAVMSGLRYSADEALREVQRDHLAPDLRNLLATFGRKLNSNVESETDAVIKRDMLRLLAWTETARLLVDPSAAPQVSVVDPVLAELDKIRAGVPDHSSVFSDRKIDYGIFEPQGHYSAHKVLGEYYQAKVWLGQVGLRIRSDEGSLNSSEARMAFLLARILDAADQRDKDRLNDIVVLERFFGGEKPGALSPEMAAAAMRAYYGFQYGMGFSYLSDDESLERLVSYLETSLPEGYVRGLEVRLMPVETSLGANLFAQLGRSARQGTYGNAVAAALQGNGSVSGVAGNLRSTLARLPMEEWVKDMQWTTLYTAQALASSDEISDKYPRFMRSEAWKERRAQSALGAFGAFTNEMGEMDVYGSGSARDVTARVSRSILPGYVEPDPYAWSVIAAQARYLREGLAERMRGSLIDPGLEEKFRDIENTAAQFARIAAAELRGISFTDAHTELLFSAPVRIAAWETYVDPSLRGESTVLVAASGNSARVGPATGHPVALYVIAPNPSEPGEPVLMRGAVYSYHETARNNEDWVRSATDANADDAGLYVVSVSDIEPVEARLRSVTSSVQGNERRAVLGSVQVELESSVVRRSAGALWYTVQAPGYDGADVITTVVDLSGRQVFQSFALPIENGERFDMVPVDDLKSGQYFLRVSDITGRSLASGRFMVVR